MIGVLSTVSKTYTHTYNSQSSVFSNLQTLADRNSCGKLNFKMPVIFIHIDMSFVYGLISLGKPFVNVALWSRHVKFARNL